MTEAKAIIGLWGDYCAFHEIGFTVEYVFGEHFLCASDEIGEIACNEFDCDYTDLKNQDKERLDKIALDWIDSFENEGYSDYEIRDIVMTIEDGEITEKYMMVG